MKVGLIQTNPQDSFEDNFKKIKTLLNKSVHSSLNVIVLPETFLFMGDKFARYNCAQKHSPNVIKFLKDFAKTHKVHIISGSIDEVVAESKKLYNTCYTFSPNGEILSKYHKLHLFNLYEENGQPLFCESDIYQSGTTPNSYHLSVENDKWNALNIICYDVRFPEIIRHSNMLYDIIFVPAAFTWKTGKDHWEILLRSRAIENQCFIVACNQTGKFSNNEKQNYGNSMIIDPWGKVLARLGEEEDLLICDIDKSDILKARKKLPALTDRKIL